MHRLNRKPELNQTNLIDYICVRFQTGVVIGTVLPELSGIIHYFVGISGRSFVINKVNTPLLIRAIKGYTNLIGGSPDIRIAISAKQLATIIHNLSMRKDPLKLMYIAALSLAFWAMLRASEYTYNSTYPLQYLLRNQHIAVKTSRSKKRYIWFKVPYSKTNKDKELPIAIVCL